MGGRITSDFHIKYRKAFLENTLQLWGGDKQICTQHSVKYHLNILFEFIVKSIHFQCLFYSFLNINKSCEKAKTNNVSVCLLIRRPKPL